MAIAAVDVESKISGLVDDVVAMTGHGLVTLERARLVGGDDVLDVGNDDAVKLTVYVGRQERIGGLPAYRAVCDLLYRQGFSGGAVVFGRRRHRARRALPGSLLQPQRQRSADDHLDRDRGAGFGGRRRTQRRRTQSAADRRTGAVVQTGRRVVRATASAAGHRRPRTAALAEADGAHQRGDRPRRRADPPRAGAPAAGLRNGARRDRAARHLGIPRRP